MESNKTAHTIFPVSNQIKERWSPRSFRDEPIETDKLKTIFEAMSWAASARNEQPWRLIVGVKNKSLTYEKIFNCLDKWNQKWAFSAPVLAIAIAKKNIEGKPNPSHAFDTGAAMATMCLQAITENIYVHQMGGIDAKKVIETFKFDAEEYEVMTGVAIGRLGKVEDLDAYYQEMEKAQRNRKNISEFVFGDVWETPAQDVF